MEQLRQHRSLIVYFAFSLATSAVGFCATMVMTRLLPPEQFGRIALFLSLQFIGVPLISFGADSLIAINKAKYGRVEYERFRQHYVTLGYLMYVLSQALFLGLYLLGVLRDHIFLFVPFYGLVRFLINLASTEFVMEGKAVQFGAIGLSTTVLSMGLTALFLTGPNRDADWRVLALVVADLLLLLVRYRGRMHLLLTFRVDRGVFMDVIRFGFPLLLAVIPAWLLNESDKFLVARFADMKSLGYYSAAAAMVAIMVTFIAAMLNALTPRIYSSLSSSSAAEVGPIVRRHVARMFIAVLLFGCLYAAAYGVAAEMILPDKYAAARKLVFLILLMSPCRGLYAVLGLVTDYYGLTLAKLRAVVISGVATVAVVSFGLLNFGVMGAAFGVGAGYLVLSGLLWSYLSAEIASGAIVARAGRFKG